MISLDWWEGKAQEKAKGHGKTESEEPGEGAGAEATEKKMLEMREEIKQEGGLGLGKRVIKRYDIRHRVRTCDTEGRRGWDKLRVALNIEIARMQLLSSTCSSHFSCV